MMKEKILVIILLAIDSNILSLEYRVDQRWARTLWVQTWHLHVC